MNTGKKESWRNGYIAVIAALVIQIAFYLWFTRHWQ